MFERFRSLFARYQNLNLITLLDNLREHRVAFCSFVENISKRMCPIRHGVPRCTGNSSHEFCNAYSVPILEVSKFVQVWDYALTSKARLKLVEGLIDLLESILKERMDDADAMQSVLVQPAEEQLVG